MKQFVTKSFVPLCAFLMATHGCSAAEQDTEALEDAFSSVSRLEYDVKAQQRLLKDKLDIAKPAVAKFITTKMNSRPPNLRTTDPGPTMACIMKNMPEKAFQWFLDSHAAFSPAGRRSMISSLHFLDSRESYELLPVYLADTAEVPDYHAEQLSPGPYYTMRVCDYAYNAFAIKLRRRQDWPQDFPKRLFSDALPQTRDAALASFRQWWTNVASTVLTEIPPLLPSDSAVNGEIEEFLKTRENRDIPRK